MGEKLVGKVSHYFSRISVAAVDVTDGELNVGDEIHVRGATTDLRQKLESMQLDNAPVNRAAPGDSVGIKVAGVARKGDSVYVVTPD
ncbi:MAG: EF-Tu/IF-2/RF-3 family GTPase [bacterium]